MFKLPHNCTHFTRQQSNAQNSPSQASAVSEPWTSRCSSWIWKGQRDLRWNCQHPLDHRKSKRATKTKKQKNKKKHLFVLYWLYQSLWLCQFSSVQFSHSVVPNSLWPHELQHIRPPCPSPTPGVYSNSGPWSQWCHPAISSSVIPFSSCP